jgi:hypothetical protein
MRSQARLKDRVMFSPATCPTRIRSRRWFTRREAAMEKLDILVANAGVTRDNLFRTVAR